ncbi:hypothetical protein GDO81_016402 [Engystomops pustulosus]|uniref:Uncharacterized protein n=1 Tax=Engystomops pustulosus TaxID=76066 RepID=A0AAV7ASQ2_ENGPU|nr:hypothetical protein GDO81_016402 [Engystomops pustulosus]
MGLTTLGCRTRPGRLPTQVTAHPVTDTVHGTPSPHKEPPTKPHARPLIELPVRVDRPLILLPACWLPRAPTC